MKLQEIKKFVREFKMPKSLQLNKWSNITDLNKFFESHIAVMDCPSNPRNIKMLHYERVMKAINILRKNKGANVETMAIIPSKVVMKKTPPPEKQNHTKITNNNSIDFNAIKNVNNNSPLKPNKDFENKNVIKDNDISNQSEDSQMSLF